MRSMDSFSAISIVVIVVITAVVLYAAYKNNQKKIKSGQIVKRDPDFVKQAHTFTTSAAYSDFVKEFNKHTNDIPGINVATNRGISTFKGAESWEAEFYKAKTAEGDSNKYIFNITRWRTHKGMIIGIQSMNALLTAIEKSFLAVDPSTKVTRVKQETETKTR